MPTINRKQITTRQPKYKHINQSSQYYNSKAWKDLRESYKISHPLCEKCLSEGRITPMEHVHHKRPFLSGNTEEQRWKLLLDENNLMSVCVECHKQIHQMLSENTSHQG